MKTARKGKIEVNTKTKNLTMQNNDCSVFAWFHIHVKYLHNMKPIIQKARRREIALKFSNFQTLSGKW